MPDAYRALDNIVDSFDEIIENDNVCIQLHSADEILLFAEALPKEDRLILGQLAAAAMLNQIPLLRSWIGYEDNSLVAFFEVDVDEYPASGLLFACKLFLTSPSVLDIYAPHLTARDGVIIRVGW